MKETQRGSRKQQQGIVISNKMNNTVVVSVERTIPHPKYGKPIKVRKKFYADHKGIELDQGDKVKIMETRPLSKLKRWRVTEKI